MGVALLDREEPHRLVARARRWLIGPEKDFERSGDAPNVVFSCGSIVRGDEIRLYYGAADCRLCLATAGLSDILTTVACERTE